MADSWRNNKCVCKVVPGKLEKVLDRIEDGEEIFTETLTFDLEGYVNNIYLRTDLGVEYDSFLYVADGEVLFTSDQITLGIAAAFRQPASVAQYPNVIDLKTIIGFYLNHPRTRHQIRFVNPSSQGIYIHTISPVSGV